MIAALVLSTLAHVFVPLAPAGAPLVALTLLILAQLVGDLALTAYDISEVVVRQTLVEDRALGRVSSTFVVASGIAQLSHDARWPAPWRWRSGCGRRCGSRRSSASSGS